MNDDVNKKLGRGLEALIPRKKSEPQNQPTTNEASPKDLGEVTSNGAYIPSKQETTESLSRVFQPVSKPVAKKPVSDDAIFHLEVLKIRPNPHQPRRNFDENSIKELASSIREFGLLQPVVVTKIEKETPAGTDVEYELIAGERRWMAFKMLGLETIPAIVKNIDLERQRLELAVIENIQRENLNPIETARAFARLQDEFNLTQREIAGRLGKSRETVANNLRLLSLPSYIQEALEKNQISETHGRLLLTIDNPGLQQKFFQDLTSNRLTTRELKEKVKTIQEEKKEKKSDLSPELKMFQEELSAKLGAPVLIRQDGEAGKITITFYSPEELKNILNKLGKGGEEYPEKF